MFTYMDRYQQEAYAALMQLARRHGGAFLCDGVGLGKTFVGLMLIERLVLREGKRVVLFAPKAAREGVWEPHLRDWLPHIGGLSDFRHMAELFTRRDEKYFARTVGVNHLKAHFNQMEKELRDRVGTDGAGAAEHLDDAQDILLAAILGSAIDRMSDNGPRNHGPVPAAVREFLRDIFVDLPRRTVGSQVGESLARLFEETILSGTVRADAPAKTASSVVAFRPIGWDRDLPLSQASSLTTQIPLVLYLRHYATPGSTIIIEEPEAHMHPAMRVRFMTAVGQIVEAGVRVLITTHSDWILSALANIVRASDLSDRRREGLPSRVTLEKASVGAWLFGLSAAPVADPVAIVWLGAGALGICAMILPGISGAFVLLIIGLYASFVDALSNREWAPIGLFAAGAVAGALVFASLLSRLLTRHHDTVMATMVGLMLGSLRVLWPWPNGVGHLGGPDEVVSGTGLEWPGRGEVLWPVVCAVAAFALALAASRSANRATAGTGRQDGLLEAP